MVTKEVKPMIPKLWHSRSWFVALLFTVIVVGLTGRASSFLQAAEQGVTPVRRVNAPYTSAPDGSISVPERAIFWFGKVGPTDDNYTDTRVIFNDYKLIVTLHIFDRMLFYKKNPAAAEMTDWDAATLYLNLDGDTGAVPGVNAYQFVAQTNWNEARDGGAYQAAYQGNGANWVASSTPFTTIDGWQGFANNSGEDRGWNVTFKIPFSSLGLTSKPVGGTVWALALAVHDRDDSAGTFIADKVWPENMNGNQPATWGQIHFGLPAYEPPPANPGGVVTIRHGLNGAVVEDGQVGGDGNCGNSLWPDFWSGWGDLNYSSGFPQQRMVIQNQWNLGDWPCFSKYYVTFPLDAIPADQAVISATLTLYHYGNSNQGGLIDPSNPPQPSLIQLLTVAEDWNEGTLTWNNAPLAVENVSRAWVDPLPAGPPYMNVPRQWDVSGAAAAAYAAGQPLRLAVYSADNARHSGKYFRSSDVGNEALRPVLEVTWGYDKGFTMAVTPLLAQVLPGGSAVFTVDVQPTDGSVSSVTVEVGDPAPDLSVLPAAQTVSSLPGAVTFTVTDLHSPSFTPGVWYTIPVTVTGGTAVQTTTVQLLLNGGQTYLPIIQKQSQ